MSLLSKGGGQSTPQERRKWKSHQNYPSPAKSDTNKSSRQLLPVKNKENDNNKDDEEEDDLLFGWRTPGKEKQRHNSKPASRGISPSIFHSNPILKTPLSAASTSSRSRQRRRSRDAPLQHKNEKQQQQQPQPERVRIRCRPGQDAVDKVHRHVIQQEKFLVAQHLEWKRSAFKTVTCLKKWPLQERALAHYQTLLHERGLVVIADSTSGTMMTTTTQTLSATTQETSSSASSSSGSSSSSALSAYMPNNEPKRALRNLFQSPAKSRLKAQFQQEFLKSTCSSGDSTTSALWSVAPRVFASEVDKNGKRKYWVGHFGRFCDKYWRKTDPKHRHYYELIVERTPCRLYFDLEFDKSANASITDKLAEGLINELFEELVLELEQVFSISILSSQMVDLDSSTETKFSRHWIVHTPRLFQHTTAVGRFVKDWIGSMAARQGSRELGRKRPLLQKYLFVNNKGGGIINNNPQSCIVDLGVYTRNRLFRLLGSSKFGKPHTAALRIAESNQFPLGLTNADFYLPAMIAAAANENQDKEEEEEDTTEAAATTVHDMDSAVRKFVTATDWTLHAEALAQTLVVPLNFHEFDLLPFEEEEKDCKNNATTARTAATSTSTARPETLYGPSPYLALDDFVLNVLATRGTGTQQGSIRSWSLDFNLNENHHGVPTRITYQISRNRYCECIGRSHKSNNVYWVVDLQLFRCVQGCHDPDCRMKQFRGTPVALPANVRESVEEALLDEALANMTEEELMMMTTTRQSKSDTTTSRKMTDCDQDVERALATLRIDDDNDGEFNVERTTTGTITLSAPPSSPLSDEALLEAVLSNPELFP